jgi:hypothetical protein
MAKFAQSPAADGAMLAVATIPLHLLLAKMQSEQVAAKILSVMAPICIGFSLKKRQPRPGCGGVERRHSLPPRIHNLKARRPTLMAVSFPKIEPSIFPDFFVIMSDVC